jgi:hypothetical protein
MVRKKPAPPEKFKATIVVPLAAARAGVSKQLDKGTELLNREIRIEDELSQAKANYQAWWDYTTELLNQTFNTDELAQEFSRITVVHGVRWGYTPPLQEKVGELRENLRRDLDRLSSIHGRLELYPVAAAEQRQRASDPAEIVELVTRRFHLVARELHNRHANRPTLEVNDEYDVQDLLHPLLKIFFNDIRPEECTPSYAGGSSRMDFLLKAEQIVVEVKKTRQGLMAKEVGDQLLVDIGRYQSHPDCRSLICFVYDPEGYIANPDGLEGDLSQLRNGMNVKVIITPEGQ